MLTNVLNLPQPFVDAATSNYKPKDKRYSVTKVLGGTCEAILGKRHYDEIDSDVADQVWLLFGSAVHKILEESKETDSQLKENWVSAEVGNGYTISGIFDLYDDDTKTVTDYKTCSCWKITFGDFDDWRKQTLMYCWILRQMGFDARHGEIVALIKDHSQRKARFEPDYPKFPVYKIGWDFTEDDFEKIEAEIKDWFEMVECEERKPDDELLPCTPEQRWHKDDKWAVMKKGAKKALKLWDNPDAAWEMAAQKNKVAKGMPYYVEFRVGEDSKCEGYCSVAQFCPYYKATHEC